MGEARRRKLIYKDSRFAHLLKLISKIYSEEEIEYFWRIRQQEKKGAARAAN
jgi:hypothetical protein